MRHWILTIALMCLLGCAPRQTVYIYKWASKPERVAQDSSVLKEFNGPLSTAIVGLAGYLTGDSIVLPLSLATVVHGYVKTVERTSDANFDITKVYVPITNGGTVVVTQDDVTITVNGKEQHDPVRHAAAYHLERIRTRPSTGDKEGFWQASRRALRALHCDWLWPSPFWRLDDAGSRGT